MATPSFCGGPCPLPFLKDPHGPCPLIGLPCGLLRESARPEQPCSLVSNTRVSLDPLASSCVPHAVGTLQGPVFSGCRDDEVRDEIRQVLGHTLRGLVRPTAAAARLFLPPPSCVVNRHTGVCRWNEMRVLQPEGRLSARVSRAFGLDVPLAIESRLYSSWGAIQTSSRNRKSGVARAGMSVTSSGVMGSNCASPWKTHIRSFPLTSDLLSPAPCLTVTANTL